MNLWLQRGSFAGEEVLTAEVVCCHSLGPGEPGLPNPIIFKFLDTSMVVSWVSPFLSSLQHLHSCDGQPGRLPGRSQVVQVLAQRGCGHRGTYPLPRRISGSDSHDHQDPHLVFFFPLPPVLSLLRSWIAQIL